MAIIASLTQTSTDLAVETLEQPEEYTRIDFISFANPKYLNGGWSRIDRSIFIRPTGTNDRYFLLKAVNIPYFPEKHHYKNKSDSLAYSLYFPALPKSIETIDVIERESENEFTSTRTEEQHFLRLYGLTVARIKEAPIKLYHLPSNHNN